MGTVMTPVASSARSSVGLERRKATVFIHGFLGSPESWNSVIDHLSGEAPILKESILGDSSFETEVDRLAGRIRGWNRDTIEVVGYSLGARLALGLLARHGKLLARATLIGVNPGLETPEDMRQRGRADERWASMLEDEGMSAFLPAWEAQHLFARQLSLPEQVREAEMTRRLKLDPRGLALSLRVLGLAQMPNYWPVLPEIQTPITLVVGAEDSKFYQIAERMLKVLPRAELRVIPGVGHNVVWEAPEAVAAALNGRSN